MLTQLKAFDMVTEKQIAQAVFMWVSGGLQVRQTWDMDGIHEGIVWAWHHIYGNTSHTWCINTDTGLLTVTENEKVLEVLYIIIAIPYSYPSSNNSDVSN